MTDSALLILLILSGLLGFAGLIVTIMLLTAVKESPEADPDRDAGKTEAQIEADATRAASEVIQDTPRPLLESFEDRFKRHQARRAYESTRRDYRLTTINDTSISDTTR